MCSHQAEITPAFPRIAQVQLQEDEHYFPSQLSEAEISGDFLTKCSIWGKVIVDFAQNYVIADLRFRMCRRG